MRASLAQVMARSEDPEELVAAELAELETLAAALPVEELEGVPPVAGPQGWDD